MKNLPEERDSLLNSVLHLIAKHSVTAYEIGTSVNLAVTGVQKIIDGQTKRPQIHTLQSILTYITNKYESHTSDIVSAKADHEVSITEKYQIIENPEDIPEQFRKWVKPFFPDMKVGAGMNNGSFPVATKYFILVPFSENVEFWVPVEGRSMIPRYNHGDLVGVSEMHFDGVFSRENYVVLLNSNSWHLKQVELTDDNFVWLNSYNTENPPKKMVLDKISKFFKVRMFIGNE